MFTKYLRRIDNLEHSDCDAIHIIPFYHLLFLIPSTDICPLNHRSNHIIYRNDAA